MRTTAALLFEDDVFCFARTIGRPGELFSDVICY